MDTPQGKQQEQLQLERLQSTLNRAYRNVPFHRNRLLASGVEPLEVESFQDLARLPFMERRDLGDHYPYGLFAVPLREIVRIHTAPGTSRNPTVSGYTKQDLATWKDIVARALRAAGVTSHDILQISLDPGLANWGRDYKDGAETIEASVIPNTALAPEKELMVLKDYKTSVLITSPSSALALSERLFKAQLNPTSLNLKTLILVGQPPQKALRLKLEERLHVQTWYHYGISEIPGPALAHECQAHSGLHVCEDHFYPEIIDPLNGRVLPPGSPGELVLTTLTTRAFPLIRFKTGDRARLFHEECPCGSPAVRMEWLPERADSLLIIRGVKIHREQILTQIERVLGYLPETGHFARTESDFQETLEIWMAVDSRIFSDEIKELQKLIQRVENRLTESIGIPTRIRLREKRSISPPDGMTPA